MKKPIIIIPTYNPTHSLIRIVRALSGANQTIIIVNDGSDQPSCASIFETLSHMRNVTLLTHLVNSGKGKALKSGLIYFKDNFPNSPGVITADADGQHDFEDIAKLLKQFKKQNQYLILGSRKFDRYVPLRSRLGNLLTRKIFKFFSGMYLEDTQTGLRAIPRSLIDEIIKIKSNRYEFELETLLFAAKTIKIIEVPIKTIYINQNESSHFNPFFDSLRIYFVFIKFISNSIITAIIDFLIFFIAFNITEKILLSLFLGRIIATIFNFSVGKHHVFKSKQKFIPEFIKYMCLWAILLTTTYGFIKLLASRGLNIYFSKIIVEGTLFFISFQVQKKFVFK